jgi:mannose/fructose/N-acetylgalactosamine-specific phosphotransferase system component IID
MLAGLTFEVCELASALGISVLPAMVDDVVELELGFVFSVPPPHAASISIGSKLKTILEFAMADAHYAYMMNFGDSSGEK